MRWGVVLVALQLAACVQSDSLTCASGITCPPDNVCDDARVRCIGPEQMSVCDGKPDDTPCTFSGVDGGCRAGICELFACGNGVKESGEQCDGTDLGTDDCTTFGYYFAQGLTCKADCSFDRSACGGTCGDGQTNGTEECDGTVGQTDCTTFGYYKSEGLVCSSCQFDTSACKEKCGDNMKNGAELCDGAPPAESCVDIGFDAGFLVCSNACGYAFSSCARFGWFRESLPIGGWSAIHGSSATNVWVGGATGETLHYDGTQWISGDNGVGLAFGQLGVIAPDDVWATVTGDILHYNGMSWSSAQGARTDVTHIFAAAHDDVWAIGYDDDIINRWNGTQWTDAGSPINAPFMIHGAAPDDVWVANPAGDIAYWNGSTWNVDRIDPAGYGFRALYVRAVDDVWVVGGASTTGSEPMVAHWDGTSWSLERVGDAPVDHVVATAPNDAWVVDENHRAWHWDGRQWLELPNTIKDAYFEKPGLGFAISADSGRVLRYTGQTYLELFPTNNQTLLAMYTTPDGHTFVSQFSPSPIGSVEHYDGVSWSTASASTSNFVRGLWGLAGNDLWGLQGTNPIHYNGLNWATTTIGNSSVLYGIWGSSNNDIWITGDQDTVWHYNGAWSARPVPNPTTGSIRSITGTGPNDVWAFDTGRLFHWTSAWSAMQQPFKIDAMAAIATDRVVITSQQTKLSYFGDGTTWTTYPLPNDMQTPKLIGLGVIAPDDIFGVSEFYDVIHFDGTRWTIVRPPGIGTVSAPQLMQVTPRGLTIGYSGRIEHLLRSDLWNCRANEQGFCDNGTDDDCDSALDRVDSDCP